MSFFNHTSIKRIEQDIKNLDSFGKTEHGGTTRLPFSDASNLAREYIVSIMKQLGLTIKIDAVGSVIGRIEGSTPNAPAIMTGSHYDTVVNGGSLDGVLGICAGLEIARIIKEQGLKFEKAIEIIAFNDEEGVRFGGGFLGSRAIAGELTHDEVFSVKDENGISMATAMEAQLFNPNDIKTALRKKSELEAFLELHIEQGPVLDSSNIDLGIVTSIVGMQRYLIEIIGRPDHAGTTPMSMRLDALNAASKVISQVSEWAVEEDSEGVATVGFLKVEPCAVNIVPSKVTFSLDIRSRDICHIHRILEKVIGQTELVCGNNLKFTINKSINVKPALMNERFQNIIEEKIIAHDYTYKKLLSGAGHDALIMSNIVDTAMIFVPSKNGRSHSPEEFTDSTHLLMGTEILFETIVDLAQKI